MKLEDKELSAVTVGALSKDSIVSTFAVVVPIMTNAVAVKKGDELSLEIIIKKETSQKDGVVENRRGQGRSSSEAQSESENCGELAGSRDRDLDLSGAAVAIN